MLTTEQKKFVNWIKKYDNPLYEAAKIQADRSVYNSMQGLGGPAADEITVKPVKEQSWFEKFSDGLAKGLDTASKTLSKGLKDYTSYRVNREEIKHQVQRVKQGLPPNPTTPAPNPLPKVAPQEKIVIVRAAQAMEKPQKLQAGLTASLPLIIGGGILWALTTKKKGQ